MSNCQVSPENLSGQPLRAFVGPVDEKQVVCGLTLKSNCACSGTVRSTTVVTPSRRLLILSCCEPECMLVVRHSQMQQVELLVRPA
eukprot:COSAG02_NODE_1104_length_14560_cov_5.927322_3_plen_86_part_00